MNVLLALLIFAAPQADVQSVKARLASQRIEVDFDNIPLVDALGVIRSLSGYNIILDSRVREDHESDTVALKLKNLSVKSVLKIMLSDKGLTLVHRQGVMVVVLKNDVEKKVVTRIHDVNDLLGKITNFPGPQMELVPPDSSGGAALSGVIFEFEDENTNTMDEDFLTELIPTSTGGDSWDENEKASINVVNGRLIITQTAAVQREVIELLRMLRQFK